MTKILIDRAVLEQALAALNASMPHNNDMDEDWPSHIAARRALRAALEQPQVEQEPVAYMTQDEEGAPAMLFFDVREASDFCGDDEDPTPLYTHPQTPRQPLTEETIYDLWDEKFRSWIGGEPFEVVVKAIERAHEIGGEK